MRARRLLFLAVPAVLSVLVSGCRFGEAVFTTDIDQLTFDPGGTVFSYLDEHDAALEVDTDPRVAVAMTWIVFDPSSDISDRDGATLAAMAHEMELRDALTIVFSRQGTVDNKATFSVTKEGDDVVAGSGAGDEIDFHLHLAPERLSSSSSYQELLPLGSRQTLEVTIDAANFNDAAPVIVGSVKLTVETVTGRDIGKARKGVIEGTFVAPLVAERTAEKNLAVLDAAANLDVLGLPLPARSGQ